MEHRPPDKCARSSLLRTVRADGPSRIAPGLHRDLHRTRP